MGANLQSIERMVTLAHDAGLPRDSLERFLSAGHVPLPKQVLFHAAARECDRADGPSDVGLGGARGGSKSHGVLAQLALDDCQRQPGLKCLLLRQVGKAAKESFEDLRPRVIRTQHKYVSSPTPAVTFPNGSRILIGHFKNESDIDNYLGLEYDVIATEEATQLSDSKNRQIGTCLRTSKESWRPRRYYTFNPGGVGHAWVKRTFVEPFRKGVESASRFIFSTFRDNPFLNPDYHRMLDGLTGWLRRAWRDGDWDIAAGQFFTNWSRERIVCEPFKIPKGWPVRGCFDYGFTHPTSAYFLAEHDGLTYVGGEYWKRKALPEQNARGIKEAFALRDVDAEALREFPAGDDVFASKGDEEGKTIAAQYAKHGIKLTKTNTDRVSRAAMLLKMLGDEAEKIAPTLRIFSDCVRLIECLPSLQHDPHRPEDVLKVDVDEEGEGGDDPYDSLGYGLMNPKPELKMLGMGKARGW